MIISNLFYQTSFAMFCNPFSIKIANYRGIPEVKEDSRLLFKLESDDEIRDHLQMYLDQAKNQKKMLEFTGLVGATIYEIDTLDHYLKISERDIDLDLLDPFEIEVRNGSSFKTTTMGAVYFDELVVHHKTVLKVSRPIKSELLELIELAKQDQCYLGLLSQEGVECDTGKHLAEFLTLTETSLPQRVNPIVRNEIPEEPRNTIAGQQSHSQNRPTSFYQLASSNPVRDRPLVVELDPELLASMWAEDLEDCGNAANARDSDAFAPSAPPEELLLQDSEAPNNANSAHHAAELTQEEENCCVICLDEKPNYIFLPCCHLVTCETCATGGQIRDCPVCKQRIQQKRKVYQ